MEERELAELVDLADAVEARLNKAEALLTVIRNTSTSNLNDEVVHGYAQTIQDLIKEAHAGQHRLWQTTLERLHQEGIV